MSEKIVRIVDRAALILDAFSASSASLRARQETIASCNRFDGAMV